MAIKEHFTSPSFQLKVTGLNNMMCISVCVSLSVRMLACVCDVQLPSSCTVYHLSQIKMIWGYSPANVCVRMRARAPKTEPPCLNDSHMKPSAEAIGPLWLLS